MNDGDLKDHELLRYARQLMLPQWDVSGQRALGAATVLVVGLGGLGSAVALYLAAAGVGRLRLVDDDRVDASNLQRQLLHTPDRIGQPKTESARVALAALAPAVAVETLRVRLDDADMDAALADCTLVVDATDNLATRYALNRACLQRHLPMVSGAAIRFEGQVTVFDPRRDDSPCYRCLIPNGTDEALNCAENGVIAPLVGVIGSMQALEAMKVIAGVGEPAVGRVLSYDALTCRWQEFRLRPAANCPDCGQLRAGSPDSSRRGTSRPSR